MWLDWNERRCQLRLKWELPWKTELYFFGVWKFSRTDRTFVCEQRPSWQRRLWWAGSISTIFKLLQLSSETMSPQFPPQKKQRIRIQKSCVLAVNLPTRYVRTWTLITMCFSEFLNRRVSTKYNNPASNCMQTRVLPGARHGPVLRSDPNAAAPRGYPGTRVPGYEHMSTFFFIFQVIVN